jgi:Co/Zn/Cd efflux system component
MKKIIMKLLIVLMTFCLWVFIERWYSTNGAMNDGVAFFLDAVFGIVIIITCFYLFDKKKSNPKSNKGQSNE